MNIKLSRLLRDAFDSFFIEYDIVFFQTCSLPMSSLGIFIGIPVLIRGNPIGGLGCSAWVGHMETTPLLFLVFFPFPSHLFVGLAYQGKDRV